MKKLLKNIRVLAFVAILAATAGHLNAGTIRASEWKFLPVFADVNPVPTPVNETVEPTPTPLPEPEIYSSGQTWKKFRHKDIISKISIKYEVDPQLIYATIMTESEGNEMAYRYEPHLGEPSLCMGQILVSTARGLGFKGDPKEMYDPEICIDLIGKYYRNFLDSHGFLSPQQLARAYNTGSPFKRPVRGHIIRFNSWFYESTDEG